MLNAIEAHKIANYSSKYNKDNYKEVKNYIEKVCAGIKQKAKEGCYDLIIFIEPKIERNVIREIEQLGYVVIQIGHDIGLNYKGCNFYKIYW